MKQIIKNATSRKPRGYEQSVYEQKKISLQQRYISKTKKTWAVILDIGFASHECTLKAPHYRFDSFKFRSFFLYLSFWKKKKKWKNHKNAISRISKKLSSHDLPPDLQLLSVHWQCPTWLRISSLISFFFEKLKITLKTPYLENRKDFSSHNWTSDMQPLNLPWQWPTIGLKTLIYG